MSEAIASHSDPMMAVLILTTPLVSLAINAVVPPVIISTPAFTVPLLASKTFYVKSGVADMTVVMNSNATSGTGTMSFLSMPFDTNISSSNLIINTGATMGVYALTPTYIDQGYCIAATAVDDKGASYESYWFTKQSDAAQATSISIARTLCLKNKP